MARRQSVFREDFGLPDNQESYNLRSATKTSPPRKERPQSVRFRSKDEIYLIERHEEEDERPVNVTVRLDPRVQINGLSTAQSYSSSWGHSMMYRFGAALLLVAALLPFLHSTAIFGHNPALPIQGVSGGAIPEHARAEMDADLHRRSDSPTHVCFRWSQMSALVNGTLYLYGGEASTQSGQTENTWNNYFLSMDLTKTWQIGSPPLVGLPQPDGPPPVALGYLWNSKDSLFLYGGEFSWKPPVEPTAFSTWEYSIKDKSWIQHSDPVTSSGQDAPSNGVPVQRAAEGAGVNVPQLGRGFYFGGHLDGYTTQGWSQSIARVYLQSLLEYTFPGYSNNEVNSLKNGNTAGSAGTYRNITTGGLQADYGFTARADGLLIYVPGFGAQGILLALAGGTNETFTQMNNVNVFDIASSKWYVQATTGPTPKIRVNPCAVVAAAPDGSSYNIYMFGGQNLIPYGNQTQYQDMWILSVPSFTWISVPMGQQSVPYGRSGATCNIWDAQMIMVGGYTGSADLTCEYPGIYVFDLSALKWQVQYTALPKGLDDSSPNNPLNQQPAQLAHGSDPGGLEGSYGYQVPELVYKKIGGGKYGGATITTPSISATAGPLHTGQPITYTVTKPNGASVTETAPPGTTIVGDNHHGPNIAAIVVGVVCGVLFVIICYLLFCLYLYRKQLKLYKRHVEMSQRQARGEKPPAIPGLWTSDSNRSSPHRQPKVGGQFLAPGGEDSISKSGSGPSAGGSGGQTSSSATATGAGYQSVRRNSEQSSTEDLLLNHEPTFVGVMLNPRRSLRVINRD